MVKCIIHGSFRKYYDIIKETADIFSTAGIEVIAPNISEIIGETNGFIHLASDKSLDPRVTELLYLKKISKLGLDGFSYYVNPKETLGTSASYELAIDQLTNTRYFFMKSLKDHPAYVPQNSIWHPSELADYIINNGNYPPPFIPQNEKYIDKMLQNLILPGSILAVGAMIIDYSNKKYKTGEERDILMVQTHKWSDKFSVVGGKVKRHESLGDALSREVLEETGLKSNIQDNICTFDELKTNNFFIPTTRRVFVDNIVAVSSRNVMLNYEAENFMWIPPSIALQELDIELNAKKTLELYVKKHIRRG